MTTVTRASDKNLPNFPNHDNKDFVISAETAFFIGGKSFEKFWKLCIYIKIKWISKNNVIFGLAEIIGLIKICVKKR